MPSVGVNAAHVNVVYVV